MSNASTETDIDLLSINTIRTLGMDAVQKASSGHPGAVMALAPLAYQLWNKHLRFDPEDPIWPDRDRFVLSNGHASMLLYAMLHLTRVKAVNADYEPLGEPSVDMEQIKSFRQLDSRTPGHPEYHMTTGVETTTGPLGQGVATSIGMALGAHWLRATYGPDLFDHSVYVVCGDGDLMEGVSGEAASFAGNHGLSDLCWFYDNNHISIDGDTALAYSDNVGERFEAYGWNVLHVEDANSLELIDRAIEGFKAEAAKPTLVIVDSHIGYGSPNKQDTAAAHGEPLGEDEVKATKRFYGWPEDAHFLVPDGVYENFADNMGRRGAELSAQWRERLAAAGDGVRTQIEQMDERRLPEGWDAKIPTFEADEKGIATRKASHKALNAIAENVPWLITGSADLTGSASSGFDFEGAKVLDKDDFAGRMVHYGVREHESAAISNGLALSKIRSVWSTYLIFSDYARPAIRLSALMELPVIHWFSHDSIGLGEDGPTHQPIEQLASLRAIPGMNVIRPCDANETAEAWRVIMQLRHEPACLALTRQNVPVLDRSRYAPASGLARGGYVLADTDAPGGPEVILIATGSEVHVAVDAHEALVADGVASRVVSLPSWHMFDQQDEEYRESVLPSSVLARVAVEQASTLGWDRYVGSEGRIIGMHTFGASAPFKDLLEKFGFTPEKVAQAARELISG